MRRIQRRRTKGYRLPPKTLVITRPSKWGNPFVIEKQDGKHVVSFDGEKKPWWFLAEEFKNRDRAHDFALACFHRWIREPEQAELRNEFLVATEDIEHLACFCIGGGTCHGDEWVRIAEEKRPRLYDWMP